MNSKRLMPFHISVYLIVFFIFWSVRELVIQPMFLSPLDSVDSAFIGEVIKLLTWTLPAVLLIRHFRDDMWIGLKEMFTSKLQWSRDYIFAVVVICLLVARPIQAWILHGELGFGSDFEPARLIGGVLFVGITEELVFRGFLLNTFLTRMKMEYAVALDAVLFVLIHYPIWIYRGFDVSDIAISSIWVAVLSVGFAYSFIKTRNILVPIVLHMVWNFGIIVFL